MARSKADLAKLQFKNTGFLSLEKAALFIEIESFIQERQRSVPVQTSSKCFDCEIFFFPLENVSQKKVRSFFI